MQRPAWVDRMFHRVVDGLYGALPRPVPASAVLDRCRLVSHRGEHDNRRTMENTLAAFDGARALGIWGIEFDLRWTRDLHPVVHHDSDLSRIFGAARRIRDLTLDQLRADFPQVPTLAEVVARYGGRMHLMMEIKAEPYSDPATRNRILASIFADLRPRTDFHLLALAPETFHPITFVPPSAFLLIGETRLGQYSRIALEKGFAGVCGHYLFMTNARRRRHHRAGQGVGTGYPASKNVLLREIHRGVDWIFSNHAGALQQTCDQLRR